MNQCFDGPQRLLPPLYDTAGRVTAPTGDQIGQPGDGRVKIAGGHHRIAPADGPRINHQHIQAAIGQAGRCQQAGHAGAHHQHVRLRGSGKWTEAVRIAITGP